MTNTLDTSHNVADPTVLRPLGATGIDVSGICVGGASWSSRARGPIVPTLEQSIGTAARLIASPLNFIDTSNNYGGGESETRLGMALRELQPPAGFIVQTKADRDMETGDFSGSQVRKSIAESLERLGRDTLPLVYLHDPENMDYAESLAPGGPVEALVALRDEGVIGHLGISGGPIPMLLDYLDTGIFEAVITHNRFTLVDRSADPLLSKAHRLGIGVINGAPYGGGLLAEYPTTRTTYHYAPARPAILAAAAEMGAYLAERGIPLAAAALQFSLRDPRITSTIVGAVIPSHIDAMLELAGVVIESDVWQALETMTPAREEWIPWPLTTS